MREAQIGIALPFCVDLCPLVFRKAVNLGGCTVVLASALQVVQVLLACSFPVSAQLLMGCKSTTLRYIGDRLNGEIGVAKLDSPCFVGVINKHWLYF